MPRDVNGNYTLPAGNPVVAGTTIDADWANPTLADLAAAMTDSLSRSGLGGLLAALKFPDGTETNPGITFTNEPTSGMFRIAFQSIGFSVASNLVFSMTPTTIEVAPGITPSGFVAEDILDNGFEMDGGSVLGRVDLTTGAVEAMTFAELAAELGAVEGTKSHGECRLSRSSATTILLSRFNGLGGLLIDGTMRTIPAAGVTTDNSSLSTNTTYFVYAFMSLGVMTLEISTTVPVDDEGVMIKTGDSTRTLVGMVRTNASTQFVDTRVARHVRTWFNDPGVSGDGGTPDNTSGINWDFQPILTWAGESVQTTTLYNASGGTLEGFISIGGSYVDVNAGVAPSTTSAIQGYSPAGVGQTVGLTWSNNVTMNTVSGASRIRNAVGVMADGIILGLNNTYMTGGSGA